MTDRISFYNEHWLWPICLISLGIWLLFLWKERSYIGQRKFYLNAIISLISIIALAMIALKPMTPNSKDSSRLVLITNDFKAEQLDSLKKKYKGIKVETYKAGGAIYDPDENPRSVFILGQGVKPFDLWQLDSIPTTYIQGNAPTGITRLQYNTSYTVGDHETIKGIYTNGAKGNKLILQGPSGIALDSIDLQGEPSQEFLMKLDSKVGGNFLFNILEKDSIGNILSNDPVPVTVIMQGALNILIINGSPLFETKYLKNFLADEGHKVAVRSRLTTSRYKFEYFNFKDRPIIGFSEQRLEPFDLVIMDAFSLRNLSRNNQNALETSIRNGGLGLLIQPELSYFRTSFLLSPFRFNSEKKTNANLIDWPKVEIGKHPYRFIEDSRIEPILKSNTQLLSGYKRLGVGRIGTTVLKNTYELVLNGQSDSYRSLWAKTIRSLGKRDRSKLEWSSNGFVGFKDEPFTFQLRTTLSDPDVITKGGSIIPLQRHMQISTLWNGKTYPRELGWHKQIMQQDSLTPMNYFVTDETHWRSLFAARTIKANKRYFAHDGLEESKVRQSHSQLDPIWFYIIFALGIGFLWLSPKL